jgi:hypothetical protein
MAPQIFPHIAATVGGTPLIKLNRIAAGLPAELYLKAEFFNPLASVKDRIGLAMIEAAERDGRIKPDTVIVEPTSGNTGIALAFVWIQAHPHDARDHVGRAARAPAHAGRGDRADARGRRHARRDPARR